ncbi:hemolysin III family protein, partial [Escherichia sp. SS-MK2]
MNAYVREPVNAFTHLGGAILSFIALLAMLVKVSIKMPSFAAITAVILFVFELISVFWLWHESTEQIQLFEQALR